MNYVLIIYTCQGQVSAYTLVNVRRCRRMAKYKSCPRCRKKMPLEERGQCQECRKNKYKYLKTLPGLRRDKAQGVYNNNQWSKTRYEVIKRAKGMCEVCYSNGKLKPGKDVHHIIKVRQGNNRTNYDINNLIYVCESCHSNIEGLNHLQLLELLQ